MSAARPPVRMRLLRAALAAALASALAAAGCESTPRGADGRRADGGGEADARPASAGAPESLRRRDERFFRVDALITQWDAAQQDGREEQAAGLARKIAEETDADFATFEAAASGQVSVAAQALAVKAMGFSRNPRATTLLVDRLRGDDAPLIGNALISLKLRADPETPLPPVIRLLKVSAIEPRRYAPLALANVVLARERVGRPLEPALADEAMTGLVGLVQDRDPYTRLHAAKALGALRRPEAVDFLLLFLRDEHIPIRIAGAGALERIGDPRAFPSVIRLLDESDAANQALVREILVSYAERIQGAPLSKSEQDALGTSPFAWDRWFTNRRAPKPTR